MVEEHAGPGSAALPFPDLKNPATDSLLSISMLQDFLMIVTALEECYQ